MRYRVVDECPFCGDASGNWNTVVQGMKPSEESVYERDETLYSVCSCGGAFQNPMPTGDSLAEFYRGDYRLTHPRDTGNRARRIFPYFPNGGGTFLDVGCSSGKLMELAAENGWYAVGVEPDNDDMEGARRFGPVYADLGSVDGLFDLVAAVHVLEHMASPVEFLRQMKARTASNGTVLVVVPKNSYRPPHLLVMGEEQVRLLLERADLQIDTMEVVETKRDTRADIIVRAH